jgi:hypothetical protein
MGVVLRKIVRNRLPGHLGLRPDVHLWLRDVLIIDHAERNSPKLGQTCWFVPKGRTARAAKCPESIAGVILADAGVRLADYKVSRFDQAPRRMSSAREFSAMHAMAISAALYRSRYLVRNASAEATRLHDGYCSRSLGTCVLMATVSPKGSACLRRQGRPRRCNSLSHRISLLSLDESPEPL